MLDFIIPPEVFEEAAEKFNQDSLLDKECHVTPEMLAYACLMRLRWTLEDKECLIDMDVNEKFKIEHGWAARVASDRVFDIWRRLLEKSIKFNYNLE